MKLSLLGVLCIANLVVIGCKTSTDDSEVKEGFDRINNPGIFGANLYPYDKLKTEAFLSGKLDQKPWTDTYWPLAKAGMADRWMNPAMAFDLSVSRTSANFDAELSKKIATAVANAKSMVGKPATETAMISPAEKIDLALGNKDLPLLTNELNSFANNAAAYKTINWEWMGHCHGWAAAAYIEKAPKNGVLFKSPSGQEIFFSPGDIRGVLTKAAADNGYSGNERFLGSRCDDPAAMIPRDKNNRIIDASIGIHQQGAFFSASVPFKVQLNGMNGSDDLKDGGMSLIGRIGPRYQSSPLVWITASSYLDRQKKIYSVRIYSTKKTNGEIARDQIISGESEAEIGIFVDSNGKPIVENGKIKRDVAAAKAIWAKITAAAPAQLKANSTNLSLKYWKECRDSNAGSFHLVLAGMLSQGGRSNKPASSFVIDITRDDQVWNHPVYSYQSRMGNPTDLKIDNVQDPFKSWRAPGTKKIVDVYTKVTYGVENGPYLTYTPEQEATHSMMLRYTLEFDDKGILLGGEWHPIDRRGESPPEPRSGKELLADLKSISNDDFSWTFFQYPDFIWGPSAGATLGDSRLLPAKFTRRLSECSQKDATDKFKLGNREIPVVNCSL